MSIAKTFDVFLSYKSEDEARAHAVRDALQRRGVLVWLDQDQIRPGDRFITALENGIETSRSVALLATPASVESGWVQDEYHRALSLANAGNLQLIPILLDTEKGSGVFVYTCPSQLGSRPAIQHFVKQGRACLTSRRSSLRAHPLQRKLSSHFSFLAPRFE